MMNEELKKLHELDSRLFEIKKKVYQIFGIEDFKIWLNELDEKTPDQLCSFFVNYSRFKVTSVQTLITYTCQKINTILSERKLTLDELLTQCSLEEQDLFTSLTLNALESEEKAIYSEIKKITSEIVESCGKDPKVLQDFVDKTNGMSSLALERAWVCAILQNIQDTTSVGHSE